MNNTDWKKECGARGESRTRTVLLPADFKSAASAIPPPGQVELR